MTINDYPKKKLIVADILRITGARDTFIIRDVTPALHAPGPYGDGIIYRGVQEDLMWTDKNIANPICSMRVIGISPYHDDDEEGYSLMVTKAFEQYRCSKCGSTFIAGDNEQMMTYMCIRCGAEMEVVK